MGGHVQLNTLVADLAGVGPQTAAQLQKLGIVTVLQLLLHLPHRYEDRTYITAIAKLRPGMRRLIEGQVTNVDIQGRRRALTIRIADHSGQLSIRLFHFHRNQRTSLSIGDRVSCFGEARHGPTGLEFFHPEIKKLDGDQSTLLDTSLTPVYPTVTGLTQKRLCRITKTALAVLKTATVEDLPELIPEPIVAKYGFPELTESLAFLHGPPQGTATETLDQARHPTQRRLAYEELLAHQLSQRKIRARMHAYHAPAMSAPGRLHDTFLKSLPYTLTQAQQRVITEIIQDMTATTPMLRLLLGDVGAGKTVVAAVAALQAIANGYQAAVMVPTEILAEQHYRTFTDWYTPLGIEVVYFTPKRRRAEKSDRLAMLADDCPCLVIGTHALIQEQVNYHRLGLVIIDEQHRFGVQQRLSLRDKGRNSSRIPHQLVMSATPIPRTLALALCADLDLSLLDELPPSRTPVRTIALATTRKQELLTRIAERCRSGEQAYWVCTLIDQSEVLQCQAATLAAQQLAVQLPDTRIGLLHGRLPTAEKEAVMTAFKSREIDLLVATTVVEVGVDVPNASLMIIENAERLGLAQLHQLRGRVGRGRRQSDCVLLYQPPLNDQARARLAAIRECSDGFAIAEKDLEIRGPGEVLGTRQSGLPRLRVADLGRDADLLPEIAAIAAEMLRRCEHQKIAALTQRWLGERQGGDAI